MDVETLLTLKSVAVFGALLLFGLWERVRPADPRPLLLRLHVATRAAWNRLGKHAGLFALNAAAGPLIVLPVTWWAEGFGLGLRPDWWTWPLDILMLDLWIYWWHRANHVVPWLWRFHQVHHLDELLDTTSAFRFHVGEVVLSACVRALVILALDIPFSSVIVFEALVLVCAIFHHSDAALPPALERIFEPHRHHAGHSLDPPSRCARRHRQQLRHVAQHLGSALPLAQRHRALPRHAHRRRADA